MRLYKRLSLYMVFISLLILFLMSSTLSLTKINATPSTNSDVILYAPTTAYPSEQVLLVMMNHLNTLIPNWFTNYDYAITVNTADFFRVRLVPRASSRQRHFIGLITIDTLRDIDEWRLIIGDGTLSHRSIRFNRLTGAVVDNTTVTTAINSYANGLIFYTNFNIYTFLPHVASVPITDQTRIISNVERRPLPAHLLQQAGLQDINTGIITDNQDRNTNVIVNTISGIFSGIAQLITDIANTIITTINNISAPIVNAINAVITPITNAINAVITPITNAISNNINNLVNQITTLPQRIVDLIIPIFIPTQANIQNYFNQLYTMFQTQFGFIYQSIAMMISIFERMLIGTASPIITLPWIFENTLVIDISYIQREIPQAWVVITTIIRGSIMFILLQNMIKTIRTVLYDN